MQLIPPAKVKIEIDEDGNYHVQELIKLGKWPFAKYDYIDVLVTDSRKDAESLRAELLKR